MKRMIKHIPNMCSIANACCGLVAILISLVYQTNYALFIACLFILFGVFFDTIDGKIARNFHAESEMGKQLDSFADLITFGVSPVILFLVLHIINDPHFHILYIIVATFYVACAMYRLARYNTSVPSDYFEGVPTTLSGLILSGYILISNIFFEYINNNIIYTTISIIIILLLGVLMVCKFKVYRIVKK